MLPLLYLWNSKAMYLGSSFETGEHSHNAVQIVVSLQGKIKIAINGEWKEGDFFIIPPNTRHKTVFLGMVGMLYADAEDVRFVAQKNEMSGIPVETIEKLKASFRSPPDVETAEKVYDEVMREAGFFRQQSTLMDERIRKCLDYIDTHSSESLSMEKICHDLHISESTFSHLFSKEVGIPFRRYLIWKRLKNAVYYFINADCSLTEAALEAGFTDQPHFTKSFKEIFGVQPSYIFGKKLKLLKRINRIKI